MINDNDKIVFLDMDGVLNRHFEPHIIRPRIEFPAVQALNKILAETKAKVVLSSSWRIEIIEGRLTLYAFAFMLRACGVHGLNLIDTTPKSVPNAYKMSDQDHGLEITRWIEINNFNGKYVVLDDDTSIRQSINSHPFVCTNIWKALTMEDADIAIGLLNG